MISSLASLEQSEKVERLKEKLLSFLALKEKMKRRKFKQKVGELLTAIQEEASKRIRRYRGAMCVVSLILASGVFGIFEQPLQECRLPNFKECLLGLDYAYDSVVILFLVNKIMLR